MALCFPNSIREWVRRYLLVSRHPNTVRMAVALSAATAILSSCSVTKYVSDDELLLDRIHIDGNTVDMTDADLREYVRQQPNPRLFRMWRLGLGIYSLSGSRPTALNEWLRNIGSAPVIYDADMAHRSAEQLRMLLVSKGYFDAHVSDTLILRHPKRCDVRYRIDAGDVYRITSLSYSVPDDEVGNIVMADTANSLLKVGDPFDSNIHDEERERLTRLLQLHGYYSFGKDYVYYVADSAGRDHVVSDSLIVSNALGGSDLRSEVPHRKAVVDKVDIVVLGSDANGRVPMPSDSVLYTRWPIAPSVTTYYSGKQIFRNRLIRNSCFVRPHDIYSLSDVELSQQRFASLKAFRSASFRFLSADTVSTNDTVSHVNCLAVLSTNKMQSFAVDLEGTNSSGNLGAAFGMRYSHANAFDGAEHFSIKGRLSFQRQGAADGKSDFYTYEAGIDASLTLPFMLFPYLSEHFYKHHNPQTVFAASYDYQRRPEFTRTVVTNRITYSWRGSTYAQHSFTPIELNVVSIPTITQSFSDYISNTYLQYAYTDHFIMSLGYNFVYNKQRVNRNQSGIYFRFNIETAGNLLNALTQGRETDDAGSRSILNIRFAQYVRTQAELRYMLVGNSYNSLACRFFAGVGVPYGNSLMLPFEKSFFAGGANSLRAWPVRGLGPGSKPSDPSLRYHNQTSDMRIEANAEYRVKMFSVFEAAFFADAGNIWALNRSHNDADAVFTSRFYKQIAIGAGLGLRLNFDYFIFRVDAAYKIHDPSAEDPWVVHQKFNGKDIAWNFAIGYPF